MEQSGHSDLQIVVNPSLKTVSSTVFQIRVSLQRPSGLITHQSCNNIRTPRDRAYASCSQEVYIRNLTLLPSINVRCVLAMSHSSPPTIPIPHPLPPLISTQTIDGNSFTIMQLYKNGIGNKLAELGEYEEQPNIKVEMIDESKLFSNSKTPSIQNFTTVRKGPCGGQGGMRETMYHLDSRVYHYGEAGKHRVNHEQRYIPQASSCTGGYLPSLDHLMMRKDTRILGRTQCTRLSVVLKLDRYERHHIREYDLWVLIGTHHTHLPQMSH